MKFIHLIILLSLLTLLSCSKPRLGHYQGYVEGENIYLASPYSGILEDAFVTRGHQVKKGELLFKLDANPEILKIKESESELLQAKKIYQDLVNPRRPAEIAAINAQILQADAKLKLAQIQVQRYRQLYARNAAAKETYDEAVERADEFAQLKAQYESDLDLAKQGSREEQINAQKAAIGALVAKLEQAKWQLSQKSLYAPADGIIFDTYYKAGEFVNNAKPIASLLTPENIRLEFFVPPQALTLIHLGQKIYFTCDACENNNQATISYISPIAEYVPPLVYSRENDDKLVFRVQAAIKNAAKYKPGQPIVVTGASYGQ